MPGLYLGQAYTTQALLTGPSSHRPQYRPTNCLFGQTWQFWGIPGGAHIKLEPAACNASAPLTHGTGCGLRHNTDNHLKHLKSPNILLTLEKGVSGLLPQLWQKTAAVLGGRGHAGISPLGSATNEPSPILAKAPSSHSPSEVTQRWLPLSSAKILPKIFQSTANTRDFFFFKY